MAWWPHSEVHRYMFTLGALSKKLLVDAGNLASLMPGQTTKLRAQLTPCNPVPGCCKAVSYCNSSHHASSTTSSRMSLQLVQLLCDCSFCFQYCSLPSPLTMMSLKDAPPGIMGRTCEMCGTMTSKRYGPGVSSISLHCHLLSRDVHL